MKRTIQNLREIQSLRLMGLSLRQEIDKEYQRVHRIEKERTTAQEIITSSCEKLEKLKQEILKLENDYEKANQSLDKTKERAANLTTEAQINATENESLSLKNRIEETENMLYQKLELVDELNAVVEAKKSFLKGSLDSLETIKADVTKIEKEKQKEIDSLKERLIGLRSLLSRTEKELSLNLPKKFKNGIFIAFLDGNNCSQCRMQVGTNDRELIENLTSLVYCHSCKRIIVTKHLG